MCKLRYLARLPAAVRENEPALQPIFGEDQDRARETAEIEPRYLLDTGKLTPQRICCIC